MDIFQIAIVPKADEPEATSMTTIENAENTYTRLTGFWLWAARWLWASATLAGLGLFAAGLPEVLANAERICADTAAVCFNVGRPTPEQAQQIAGLGLSLPMYGVLVVAPFVLKMLVATGVGIFLFIRKSNDWLLLVFSLFLILFGTTLSPTTNALVAAHPELPILWWLWQILIAIRETCLSLSLTLFPNGRPVPRWMMAFPVFSAVSTLIVFFPDSPISQAISAIFFPILILSLLTLLAAQVYRYRRVSTPLERQQTWWVVWGLALMIGLAILQFTYLLVINPQSVITPIYLLNNLMGQVAILGLPVTLAISILRYRLWDLDLIIRKTVLYTIVSGLALGVYLLVVGATSMVLGSQQRDFVIPLVVFIAAVLLFRPLANRLERWMDKVMPLKPRPQYDDEG